MAESPSGPRALPVDTIRIESVVSYQVAREYTGTIVARRVSELSFERPGLLESVQVDEGTAVAEGTPLATLDTEHLLTRRRETRARHAQAVAQLNEMITGARQEDIDAARAQVASLEAQVELLTLQTTRSNRLIQSRATSQAKLEEYTFGLKARQGQLGHARHELAELINGTRREQIDAQKAIVEQLDAAIEDVDVDLRKSVLKTPFSGTIARRFTDDGTVVSTGQPILKLIEDSALEAWVGLPVAPSVGVADDSAQRVRIAGRTFDARVSGRRPEVDPATRTRTVILQLDASAADFMVHGQIVRLQLEETVVSSGFWLPTTALTKGERGLWSCLVAVPEQSPSSAEQARCRVERRDVEVLHTESERVFVRGTVSAGDQVVARGIHRISPGQIVRTSAVVQAASL
ncbi:MAG TPA: HlyD family efflux transporter periplasmic adaptor subunit [Planctomycetes bacterium]|nr:HlyD family efflux transporter periplasmic adaptor subunit [Fuerstiella sp.]HIK95633.1 HlyD family efflux transporter periplasmic adaptor subunit [Planctomycetota bacterium]